MPRDDLEKMRSGVPHGVIAETELGAEGKIDYRCTVRRLRAGGGQPVAAGCNVFVRIRLDFGSVHRPMVTSSRRRRLS